MKAAPIVVALLSVLAGLVIGDVVRFVSAQERVPLATEADTALAPLAISRDGRVMTIRSVAPDSLKLCVEPALGKFAATKCFSVGAIRRGEVK